jgi:cyclohexanone monooxygenase
MTDQATLETAGGQRDTALDYEVVVIGAGVAGLYEPLVLLKAKSWITGYNSKVDGHEYGKTRYNIYNGGGPRYGARLREVAEEDYRGITFA